MKKIISTAFKLSLVPRWGDHSSSFKDNVASHSYRTAVLALMISRFEREGKVYVDEESLLLKALFHDFNEVITGPIKHETKKSPKLAGVIEELEKRTSEEILTQLPEELRHIFRNYLVNAEDDSIEGRIVDIADSLDAYLFCSREVESNNNAYFERAKERLREKLLGSEFKSVRSMVLTNDNERSGLHKFLKAVLDMDKIKRWSGMTNNVEDDDATHTFRVAVILALLAKYEDVKKGTKNDIVSIVGKSLFHDLPESLSGDIKGPIKHSSKELKEAFEGFESNLAEEICKWIPESVRDGFEDLLIHSKGNTKEGMYVDIGDKLDAMIKSIYEMSQYTKEYKQSYKTQLKNMREKYSDEFIVNYFLSDPLHDFYIEII